MRNGYNYLQGALLRHIYMRNGHNYFVGVGTMRNGHNYLVGVGGMRNGYTSKKCCVAVGTWCVGFSNELLLAKEMESKKLQQELRYFHASLQSYFGPCANKSRN